MADQEILEPITVGLSAKNHEWLEKFKQEKIFLEMMDGYRFAIAYALNKGIVPPDLSGESRKTAFNIGSLDQKKEIYNAIISLTPDLTPPVYKYAERLAEWGVNELVKIYEKNHRLDLAEIIAECNQE
jgi:hypothetical protein